MFEASLFESAGIRIRDSRGLAIAATVQTIALAALFAAPLFSPARLPARVFQMTLTAPAPPPPVVPPIPRPVTLAASVSSAFQMVSQVFVAPKIVPHGIREHEDAPAFIASSATSTSTDAGSGVGKLLNTLGVAATPAVRAVVPTAKRAQISGGVMQGQLVSPIRPIYPAIALAAHMQGTVVVAATISRAGAIENLQVMSGPMMLRRAALDAIQQAHYKPFKLNGEPVEVDTTISVVFSLADAH